MRSNELMDKPCQIFNCDETGMPLAPHPPRVVTMKGVKHSVSITSGEKSQITVLACCSAGGYAIPPFVIFDRKTLKPELAAGEVPGTMYGLSSSGWIDAELFDLWFTHHFLAYAPPTRPLLLLLDGHSSHYDPSVICRAAEEQVIIFCLPPHTTHISQPLDNGCFGALKRAWAEECHRYLSENPGRVVTRYQFSELFHCAWRRSMTMTNVISGFRSTGVYPLNRHALMPAVSKPQNFNPTLLSEKTGLKYIPLYSPARRTRPDKDLVSQQGLAFSRDEFTEFQRMYEKGYKPLPHSRYSQWLSMYHPDSSTQHCPSDSEQDTTENVMESMSSLPYTASEVLLFERRREEGWDLQTDPRYNQWLKANTQSMTSPDSTSVPLPNSRLLALTSSEATMTLPDSTSMPLANSRPLALSCSEATSKPPLTQYSSAVMAKILKCPTPVIKVPSSRKKSSGRVLTSLENIKMLEEKKGRRSRNEKEEARGEKGKGKTKARNSRGEEAKNKPREKRKRGRQN